MSSRTQSTVVSGLQRRVKARRLSGDSDGYLSPHMDNDSHHAMVDSVIEVDDDNRYQPEFEASDGHGDAVAISFGALVAAQAHANQPRNPPKSRVTESEPWVNNEELERKAGRQDRRDFNRSSKHAPTEISSKKAISRRREAVPVVKRQHRDPRFDPLSGTLQDGHIRAAYSFLNDYRMDEIKDLKMSIKSAKDEGTKDNLKKSLMSLESMRKAQLRKEKEQEILDKHLKDEKELVKLGKQPFYLKKAEQKRRLLLDQYGELRGKQIDRVIARRRKKVEGKEKKSIPFARRALT